MAKLKRTVPIKNIADATVVAAALDEVKKTCASGLPAGEAALVLHFDAPSIETARRRKDDGEEEEAGA